MALFNQFANVVEWEEFQDDMIFWKWSNKELKAKSRLIIRPGQDAIFIYNGRIQGIFHDEGNYEIESDIIPFLSDLKGFKFGFNSGLRAEVLFVNTREFTVKWGTKNSINLPAPSMPGGLPVRAFGTFNMRVVDYVAIIDNIAGLKHQYTVDDVKLRVTTALDQLVMRHMVKEGKDMFNLQMNAADIARGVCADLDMQMRKIGISITDFVIANVNYPEEIQEKIDRNAAYNMVGDIDRYQRVSMADAALGDKGTSSAMGDAFGAAVGMAAGLNMANAMNRPPQGACSKCGGAISPDMRFCARCGASVAVSPPQTESAAFCPACGKPLIQDAAFCPGCGAKVG